MNDRHIENAHRRQRDRVLARVLGVGAWFTMLLLTGCSLPQFELAVLEVFVDNNEVFAWLAELRQDRLV
ncbi:MAG: hypothetical protein AAGJ56_04340, partial [Myxococcota bacterium]